MRRLRGDAHRNIGVLEARYIHVDIKKYTKAFEYPPQAAISRMSCSTSDPRHLSSGVSPEPLTFNTSAPYLNKQRDTATKDTLFFRTPRGNSRPS